ncbi:MAG: hypothetical protein JXR91_00610 [Deltaproteobacteria bacterium]|nr:hypothetical protein [Deltaproteobacteria bacterium]
MRVNILTILIILFAGSSLYAQLLIEDPIYGSVLQKRSVLSTTGGITTPLTTSYSIRSALLAVADSMQSSAVTGGYQLNYSSVHGVLEFDIQPISIPDTITSQNFTAKLMGLTGALQNTSEDLKIDLYPLMKDQRNGYISKDDFNAITGSASKEGPFTDVFLYPDEGIDVTEQVKESLFGVVPDDYLGFIMIPNSGLGVAAFAHPELVKIKISPVTDSDTVDTETASDTSSQTDSADTTVTEDTDSTETDTDIDTDISDPDVSCSCNTTVGYNPLSILKLIF